MHEPGDRIIVGDIGLAVAPGLHTLFDIAYTVVSMDNLLLNYKINNTVAREPTTDR